MNIIAKWLLNSIIIILAAYLLPGIYIDNFITALAIALVLGIFNVSIKPVLIILTLPLTIVTLGLFLLVINALLILLTSSIVPGFHVDGFWWAFLFGIFVCILHIVALRIFGDGKK